MDLDQNDQKIYLPQEIHTVLSQLSARATASSYAPIMRGASLFSSHEPPVNHGRDHYYYHLLKVMCSRPDPTWSSLQAKIWQIWHSTMSRKLPKSSPGHYSWPNGQVHPRHQGRQFIIQPNTPSTSILTTSWCILPGEHHAAPLSVSPKCYIHWLYLQILDLPRQSIYPP